MACENFMEQEKPNMTFISFQIPFDNCSIEETKEKRKSRKKKKHNSWGKHGEGGVGFAFSHGCLLTHILCTWHTKLLIKSNFKVCCPLYVGLHIFMPYKTFPISHPHISSMHTIG